MRHEARMHVLQERIQLDWMQTRAIKENRIGRVIETDTMQELPEGAERTYHVFSKDLITNEIFRRVEPQGRTMGEYFREELMTQLDIDLFINMEEEEMSRVHDVKVLSIWKQLKNMLIMEDRDRAATLSLA